MNIISLYLLCWIFVPKILCSLTGFQLMMTSESAVDYLTFPMLDYVDPVFTSCCNRPNFITVDARTGTVYWTDTIEIRPAIYMSKLGVTSRRKSDIFLDTGIVMPEGIALDWISQNLYFADSVLRSIFVCAQQIPRKCAVVIHEDDGNKPCGIALMPNKGKMFWTVFGKYPSINTANMDGTSIQKGVTTQIIKPTGIVVNDGKIYWVDTLKETIESASFNGENRQIITKSQVTPAIDIIGDMMYWFDLHDFRLMEQNLTVSSVDNAVEVIKDTLADYMPGRINSLHVMDILKQPIEQETKFKRVECLHGVSTLSEKGVKCLCSTGTIKSGEMCLEDSTKPKLLVAVNNTLYMMQIGKIGENIFEEIPLAPIIEEISAMVYNPINRNVVISETASRKIVEYDLETEEVTVLVEKDILNAISIDIDATSENLIWLDADKQTVEMMSLRTRSRHILLNNATNVQEIASFHGKLYFTKTGNTSNQEIHKIDLLTHPFDTLMHSFPNSTKVKIDCDRQKGVLTYALVDAGRQTIKTESATGTQSCSKVFRGGNIVELEKIENQIYWVDEYENLNVFDDLSDEQPVPRIININGILSFTKTTRKLLAHIPGSDYLNYINYERLVHECSPLYKHSAPCPHICIPYPSGNARSCQCPLGFHLVYNDNNSMSCMPGEPEIEKDYLEGDIYIRPDTKLDKISSQVNSGISGTIVWIIVVLALLVLILLLIVMYLVCFRGTRNTMPFLFPKPYVRQQE